MYKFRSLNVSRETHEALEVYVQTLLKWQSKINLIAASTADDVWARHLEDSMQCFPHFTDDMGSTLDVGSGGGMPAIPLAIYLKYELNRDEAVTMVESDTRKVAFLNQVSRQLALKTQVINQRIEDHQGHSYKLLTARAFKPLTTIFDLMHKNAKDDSVWMLLKGRNWQQEISKAEIKWQFAYEAIQSKTEPEARILRITDLSGKQE